MADELNKDDLEAVLEENDAEESVADSIADALKELEGESDADAESPDQDDDDQGAAASESDDPEDDASDEDSDDDGQDADPVLAPEHWSQTDRDAFQALPDEAKQPYLDARKSLERGYQTKFDDLAGERAEAAEMRKLFAPFEASIAQEGLDRVGALRRLVAGHDVLTNRPDEGFPWLAQQQLYKPKDPAGTVKAIAAAWGVDLGASETTQAIVDPVANDEIAALKSKIADLERFNTDAQATATTQAQNDAQATLTAFVGAKDEAGNPKHPHFETVKARMGGLMRDGIAETLEDAYEQAVWSDPALRGDLLKQKQTAQKAKDEAKQRAEKNKRAARNVSGQKTVGSGKAKELGLREGLEAEWDRLSA